MSIAAVRPSAPAPPHSPRRENCTRSTAADGSGIESCALWLAWEVIPVARNDDVGGAELRSAAVAARRLRSGPQPRGDRGGAADCRKGGLSVQAAREREARPHERGRRSIYIFLIL